MSDIILIQTLDHLAELLGKSWLDYIASFSTILIALMVAYIAYRQYKVDETRLRHEIYKKKVEIFKQVMSFISETIRNGGAEMNTISEFYKEISEARFLFKEKP